MSGPDPALGQRLQDLIVLTERLTALLASQAKAFEARRPHEAARNMEETTRLANLYRFEAQKLRETPGALADASAELRQRLTQATEAFDAVIARHGRALMAAKTVTEGLVHAIAEEVARQRTRGATYGPTGAKPTGAPVTAVTLNHRA